MAVKLRGLHGQARLIRRTSVSLVEKLLLLRVICGLQGVARSSLRHNLPGM